MEKVAAQGGLKVIIQFINVYPKILIKSQLFIYSYKTLGRLNYYNLAIQLRMRHRIFTRPFIVDLLTEGKPMINTVLPKTTWT